MIRGDLTRVVVELEAELGVGEERCEVLEAHTAARVLGGHPVDLVDAHERGGYFSLLAGGRVAPVT